MAQLEFTAGLARLLADGGLRCRFVLDPPGTAAAMPLQPAARDLLLRLDHAQLEQQAQALLDKRRYEAFKLLPRTVMRLGAQAPALFQAYAEGHWPEGYRRHHLDACAFGRFLKARACGALDEAELNLLAFHCARRRVAIHVVRTGQRMMDHGVQILYRTRRARVRQWHLQWSL